MSDAGSKRSIISIEMSREQRDLVERAAAALGKSLSEFIVESACREATDASLDRTQLVIGTTAWQEFNEALDRPPRPSEALRRLMNESPPWEV